MDSALFRIAPILVMFALGYILKRIGFFKKEHGDLFLKTVFYIGFPALTLSALSSVEITRELIYLPLFPTVIVIVTFLLSYAAGRILRLERKTLGTFLVGTMIMNTAFLLPFISAAYGPDGLSRMILFDMGNGFIVFTFVYFIALRHGENKSALGLLEKVFLSPPFIATLIALAINLSGLHLPEIVGNTASALGGIVSPLLMLTLGIYFSAEIRKLVPLTTALGVRHILGLVIGLIIVYLFSLTGMERIIVLASSIAPAGFNTLTFSALENLDREFASELVSLSILIGFVAVPVMILLH